RRAEREHRGAVPRRAVARDRRRRGRRRPRRQPLRPLLGFARPRRGGTPRGAPPRPRPGGADRDEHASFVGAHVPPDGLLAGHGGARVRAAVFRAREVLAVTGEDRRQAIHFAMTGFALALRWLEPWQAYAMAGAAIVLNWILLPALGWDR